MRQLPTLCLAIVLTLCPTLRAQDATPPTVGGDVLPPKVLHAADPKYPDPVFGKRKSSDVIVGLIVDEQGNPQDITIVRSGGSDFDASAIRVASQYKFRPATRAGRPVKVRVQIRISFRVH